MAEGFESMRQFEQVWPSIEGTERKQRRGDRVALVIHVACAFVLITCAVLTPAPWSGFIIGAGMAIAFTIGRLSVGIELRRRSFEQLRELHEQAEFTLSYHDDDDV